MRLKRTVSLNTKQIRLFDFKQKSIYGIAYDWYSELSYGDSSHAKLYGNGTEWKKVARKIRIRDNCQCQLCWVVGSVDNKSDVVLDVHHIDYNKKKHDENNLITLCKPCHSKTLTMRTAWKIKFKSIMLLKSKSLWVSIPNAIQNQFCQMELFKV